MASFNDFAIDPCVAAQLKICLQIKECLLRKYQPATSKVTRQLGGAGSRNTLNASLRENLDTHYVCLLAELERAYTLAGETFPSIPTLPSQIDMSAAAATAAPLQARVDADPLDYLSSVLTVEFDDDGNPTFIRCPTP